MDRKIYLIMLMFGATCEWTCEREKKDAAMQQRCQASNKRIESEKGKGETVSSGESCLRCYKIRERVLGEFLNL